MFHHSAVRPMWGYFAAKIPVRHNPDNAGRPPRVRRKIFLPADSGERIFPLSLIRLFLAALWGRKIIPTVATGRTEGKVRQQTMLNT